MPVEPQASCSQRSPAGAKSLIPSVIEDTGGIRDYYGGPKRHLISHKASAHMHITVFTYKSSQTDFYQYIKYLSYE